MELDKIIKEINQKIIQKYKSVDLVDPITQITDQLFIGQGRMTAYSELLSQVGITHIVSVGRPPHHSVKVAPFIKYELQGVNDIEAENLLIHLPQTFTFIRNALKENGRVFFHCEMGCSRAPTVLIAFLRAEGYYTSLQSTYDAVKSKRPWISPNLGFMNQLRKFFSEPLRP